MATRSPKPAASGVIAELGVTSEQVLFLIAENAELSNLEPSIDEKIKAALDARIPTDLNQLGGTIPASAVRVAASSRNAELEFAAINLKLSGVSATAPRIVASPTFAGTPAIGSTLTLNLATVGNSGIVEGSGGSHTNIIQLFGTNAAGVTAPLGAPFVLGAGVNQTSLALVYPTHTGLRISASQTPVDVSGAIGNSLTSPLTIAVTSTPPANSGGAGLPTVSPGGSQSNLTTFTFGAGSGWSNDAGATVSYQPTLNGAAFGPAQVSTSYTPGAQVVGTLGVIVTKTTLQGSTSVASGNTVTLTGTPTISFVTPPSFPSAPQVGVPIVIAPGVTTGATADAQKTYQIFIEEANGLIKGLEAPYASITGVDPVSYTPEVDFNGFMKQQTGLDTLAGAHVRVAQVPYVGNQAFPPSALSASRTIVAAAAAIVATTAIPTLSVTPGVPFSAAPVVGSGGSATLAYSHNAGTITGVTFNSTTGTFSGTATNEFTLNVTVTVSDGVNTPATSTFQFVSAAVSSSLTPLFSIRGADLFSTMNGYVQAPGGGSLSGVNEGAGITLGTTIPGPYGATNSRFCKVNEVGNPTRKSILCGGKAGDGPVLGHKVRVEMGPNQSSAAIAASGQTVWISESLYIPASRFSSDTGAGNVLQCHQSDGTVDPFGPFALVYYPAGAIAPNACLAIVSNRSVAPHTDHNVYHWISDNGGGGPVPNWPKDQYADIVFKFRGDPPTNSGQIGGVGTGFLSVWLMGNLIVDAQNIKIGIYTPGFPNTYVKSGYDDFTPSGGTTGGYQLYRAFEGFVDNANVTLAKIRARLT